MKPLPNKYDHKETEKRWQKTWEEKQVYAWDESESRENTYVIDTPPPTVSGLLHMGHVFSYAQADFVARYQRMAGKTVFYPMGFDDNGLPTERLVEKVKKVRATDMSREDFIELCEGVSQEARKEFRALFEEIALSVDWKQEYHTISEDSRKISQASFLDLYRKERSYRKLQPMLWDPVDQTAIAQAEIEDKEMPSQKNYIHFGLVDENNSLSPRGERAGVRGQKDDSNTPHPNPLPEKGEGIKLKIMTTRPELLGACVAVIYNPNDERYQDLKGKKAVTPVFGVKVDIISDEKVDMEKGTGLVMCCTFGDETDIAWWREHGLATRLILNKYGKIAVNISDNAVSFEGSEDNITPENVVDLSKAKAAYEQIQNLKSRTTAREKMLELLAAEGAIFKEPEVGVHAEPCAERSGSPLEILPTYQWFIKILDQKEELKAKAAECNWYPQFMKLRMDQWIDGLSWDWCISRQRYFGVPFPVWYVESVKKPENSHIILARPENLPVNPLVDLPIEFEKIEGGNQDSGFILAKARLEIHDAEGEVIFEEGEEVKITPEADVMDTWATSSVSPQLSSKGITKELVVGDNAKRHAKLFPADLRPQAHEIIRTWAFYTVVKAHLHENTIPWKNLMISGWCLASDKTKMSKSKGNVITPVTLIEEKGSDIVRFWASTSRLGADAAYSEDVLKIGKKLVTKLWNATKFAAIHLDKLEQKPATPAEDVKSGIINETLDLWVLTKLGKTVEKATSEFDKYEYCNARAAAEDFFWNDFCDNYLELVKTRVYGEAEGTTAEGQMSAVHTIYHCLDGILRLFAPIVPHITEELYSHIFDEKVEELGGFLNGRGTWPKTADYPRDETAENSGAACVSVLEAVRKMKAARNVSIKWPLNFIAVAGDGAKEKIGILTEDLKHVTSASEIIFSDKKAAEGQGESTATDDGKFTVTAEFSKENSNAA